MFGVILGYSAKQYIAFFLAGLMGVDRRSGGRWARVTMAQLMFTMMGLFDQRKGQQHESE